MCCALPYGLSTVCRRIAGVFALTALTVVIGCGGGRGGLNTAPLTEEQKRQIKMEDEQIADEEMSGGSGKKAAAGKAVRR